MRRARWFALAAVLCASAAWAGNPPLRVDEEHVRLHLLPSPVLELPIVNDSGKPLEGDFRLEFLDTAGRPAAWTTGTFHEEPGTTLEKIPWAADKLPVTEPSSLAWHRLRYELTPNAASGAAPARGVIQVGRVLEDTFELRMTAAGQVKPGEKYPVRVRVDQPKSGRGMARVPVEVTLTIGDDDDTAIVRKVVTNSSGYATATFDLPRKVESDDGEVRATAMRGPFQEGAYIDFHFPTHSRFTLSTDKPLYQPGQTVHMRVTAFGPDKRALPNAALKITIKDEDDQELFHQAATTSRFGIASADWDIPQKLPLGDFHILATLADDEYSGAQAQIRISRYDLPTYTVVVTPDRPYYLPGQDARVEVRADYLFGKPVQHAKVKVVRRAEWHWDYRDQKWEGEEKDPIEGEFDAAGRFTAHISLKKAFEDFRPDRWEPYEDLELAAYVTDLSTGRTEQRRFRIRLSALPIHLRVLSSDSGYADAPLVLYLTSSYADGAPASVEGTIVGVRPSSEDGLEAPRNVTLGRFHTNRFGVGRVELPPLPRDLLGTPEWYRRYHYRGNENQREAHLVLEASDGKGNRGETTQDVSFTLGENFLRVRTDHALYRAGEAIEVSLLTNAAAREAIVDLVGPGGLLSSQVVHLDHGRAQLTLDYDPRFHGALFVTAYAITGSEDKDRNLVGTRQVLFPGRQELQLALRMAKAVFRPGEEATAQVGVRTPEGEPVESALGLLVFDRAVAERVRTDEQFGREYGFSVYDFLADYYGQSIAGITYRDLLSWESGKPFPEGLDLLGEAMMAVGYGWENSAEFAGGGGYTDAASSVFHDLITADTTVIAGALKKEYEASERYPHDAGELREILKSRGVDFDAILDPWAMPYGTAFSVAGANDVLTLVTSGPDKRAGTADDFTVLTESWRYFRPIGERMNQALVAYQRETGKYVRDYPALREAMKKQGTDLDALRDPWGRPYRFAFPIEGANYAVKVTSAGPDGIFDTPGGKRSDDDVQEWTAFLHYFIDETAAIERALALHYAKSGSFPQNEAEFRTVLDEAKLTPQQLLDPWGRPYKFTFAERSRYWDRVTIQTEAAPGQESKSVTKVTPVTQKVAYIDVVSDGPDAKQPSPFTVAEFSRVLAEFDARSITALPATPQPPAAGGHGTLRGTVSDQSGAVVTGAQVSAISEANVVVTATTDSAGTYQFTGLPSGIYQLKVEAQGFQTSVTVRVPVQEGGVTVVDVTLQVGALAETVEVQASVPLLQTESSQVVTKSSPLGHPEGGAERPLFTPRLRKYFPETLLWRPEVVTDKQGRARFQFTMADNITAWSMSVVATDEAGQVGIVKRELRTFQPFFLEHDPPKTLTQGDTISLPVVLRNYLDKPQALQTEMKPEAWFQLLSAPRQAVTVAANGDASAIFTFRAVASVRQGKQRVTARNATTGDAVEREVQVHPDGEEVAETTSRLLAGGNTGFEVVVPATAIPGSVEGELRIYPNLVAHVFDAMRGIGRRPTGCAEQITSTAYVSLMALELLKKAGQDDPAAPRNQRAAVAKAARDAVREGYYSLADMQRSDGGYGYWKLGEADPALTAYVLRFLTGAAEFVATDGSVARSARAALIQRQQKSGGWSSRQWRPDQQGKWALTEAEDPNLTAYITRALAETMPPAPKEKEKDEERAQAEKTLTAALHYLEQRIDSWQDPYLVGNYAIAAAASGRTEHMANARALLRQLAHREGPATYWNLEANTSPFYGWGVAGRVETTSLAVEALSRMQAAAPDPELRDLVAGGLQYLLTHKDPQWIWYSTQATQNAVEAMTSAIPGGEENAPSQEAVVLVNGRPAGTLHLPAAREVVGPAVLELPEALSKGSNRLELSVPGGAATMNAQMVTSWYIPWAESAATAQQNFKPGDTRALRLGVSFDRTQPALGDTVTAHVEAERAGFRGYGMMLAEIGLPPGAEVERASLETAGVDSYEVQPDRLVVYLWPQAGGTKFDFRFHLRYREDALAAPSVLYDYYNPESRAVVVPAHFTVR